MFVDFHLPWGLHALLKLLRDTSFTSVLDVGSGAGEHARLFRLFGKEVITCNLFPPADFVGDFLEMQVQGPFDVIWCSHMLEHQRNPGLVLDKMYDLLKEDGHLAICLPHHPPSRLVPGHLSTWSLALACQHLVQAGFDCREISAFSSYELSLIVQKKANGPKRRSVEPAWEEIQKFLPSVLEVGGESDVPVLNWEEPLRYVLPGESRISVQSKNLDQYPWLRPEISSV